MKALIAIELTHDSEDRLNNERLKLEDLVRQAIETRQRYSNAPTFKFISSPAAKDGEVKWQLPS